MIQSKSIFFLELCKEDHRGNLQFSAVCMLCSLVFLYIPPFISDRVGEKKVCTASTCNSDACSGDEGIFLVDVMKKAKNENPRCKKKILQGM